MLFILLSTIILGNFLSCTVAIATEITNHQEEQKFENSLNSNDKTIKIDTIIIKNSSILTEEQQDFINKNWQGEYQQLDELLEAGLEIASFINKLYKSQGYVTSWANFPPQDQFNQGILTIEVFEGSIEEIKIQGVETIDRDYILSRLGSVYAKPLNNIHLANDLDKLARDPLIKRLESDIREGSQKNLNVLVLNIEENLTQTLSFQGNNTAPAGTGSEEGSFNYNHKNLFGGGQELFVQYSRAQGKDLGYAFFSFPITSQNTRLQFRGQIESNDIIIEPLSEFEFENDVTTYGVDLIHPIFENNRNSVTSTLTYDNHRSQNYIFGERFETDDRFPNGIAQYDGLRFSLRWIHRRPNKVLSFTPQLNFGLDRGFFYGRFWGDFLESISEDLTVSFHIYGQAANNILFPQEQCKIGGSGFSFGAIRGYTRQAFRNDNCISATLQSTWVFFKNEQIALELTPFLQGGAVFKAQDSQIPEETLASTGLELGVYWGSFFVKAYSAIPLVNVVDELEDPLGIRGGFNLKF